MHQGGLLVHGILQCGHDLRARCHIVGDIHVPFLVGPARHTHKGFPAVAAPPADLVLCSISDQVPTPEVQAAICLRFHRSRSALLVPEVQGTFRLHCHCWSWTGHIPDRTTLRWLVPFLEEHHIAHEEHLWNGNKEQRDIRVFDRILLLVLEKLDDHARKVRAIPIR